MTTEKTIDPQHVVTLRARLQGSVLLPGDEGYERACQTWDAKTFDQHPAVVVLPARASDVQAAVTFAREHNLPIAMQGGGHGHPHPADGALPVNFANMTDVQIELETATARVEPGATWKEVIQAASPYGLAPQAFSPGDIETLLSIAGNAASGIGIVEMRHLGGALARQPEDAMAFNCRQAHFYLEARVAAPS